MWGIRRPYARATSLSTSYALPENTSRASILFSILASQAVCARTLKLGGKLLALAVSREATIAPNRMTPATIFLATNRNTDMPTFSSSIGLGIQGRRQRLSEPAAYTLALAEY